MMFWAQDRNVRKSWPRRALGAAAAAAAVSGWAPGPISAATPSSIARGVGRAEAVVAEYSRVPQFIPPGPAFDAGRLDGGKTLFSIPVASQDPFLQILESDMQQVAKRVGIRFVDYSNRGGASAWAAGMHQAVAEHANLIDLLGGINPEELTPQVERANAAHIPVVASDAYSLGQKSDPMLAAVMDVPYAEAGTIMADWAIVNSNGHADALVIESNDVVSSPEEAGAAITAFHANCPECTVRALNIPVADWASQTQTKVASYLKANPGTNYVLPVYDSQSQYLLPVIAKTGDTGAHIVTYDGTAFVLDYLRQGRGVIMDVGEDLKWVAWAVMDQEMRVMAGLAPVPNEHTPMMIWTAQNIAQAGNPPQQSEGYGNGFVTGYLKLWGLAS